MNQQAVSVKERRNRSRHFVTSLVTERQELLVRFSGLAGGLEPYAPKGKTATLLTQFCQVLVDYIAAGHFGLYERISRGEERRRGVADIAARIYARIAASTEAALAFNDRYDGEKGCADLSDLADRLSKLGEELATRIDLENQLLERLM